MICSGISDEAGKPIDVQIAAHKELGWDYIELRNIDGTNLTDVSDEQFEEICGKVTDAGLKVSDFASQLCNWSRPITTDFEVDRAELARAIPRMQTCGTKFIRIMSYPNDKENPWPDETWRDEAVRRIKELAKMAEDGGVMLAHENCNGWGGEGPEHSLELLERVDSPALTLLWDTGNPVLHDQDAWDYFYQVRQRVTYVHIKDAVHQDDGSKKFTFCGEGEGAVQRTLCDLAQEGYDGFISIEPHLAAIIHESKDADDPDAAYRYYIEYGRRLMKLIDEAKASCGS